MSGRERPTPTSPANPASPEGSSPRTYWGQPASADPLAPGQLIRAGWRLYRATPRRFLMVAAIPELIRTLLLVPSLVFALGFFERLFEVMADYLRRVAENPEALESAHASALELEFQAELQALLLAQADLPAWLAVAGGASVAVSLLGGAALTAAALAAADGRSIAVVGVFRDVFVRGGLVKPALALGVASAAISWLPLVLQTSTDFQAWAGAPGSPRSVLLGSLLGVLALTAAVGIVVLGIRWALYLPAVLAERLGVWPGLARSGQLSRGVHIRLALAIVGVLLLSALSVGIVATAVGFAVGIAALSVAWGLAAYLVAAFVGYLLWAPLLPAVLAVAYRERTRDPEPAAVVA